MTTTSSDNTEPTAEDLQRSADDRHPPLTREAENRLLKDQLARSQRELDRMRRKLETLTVDHHRTLAEKLEIEERFRYLARNIREVFWIRTPDEVLFISPSYEKIWQRSCQSLLDNPNSYLDGIHPQDRNRVAAAAHRKYCKNDLFDEEYRVVRPDGTTRWVWARSFPGEHRGGKLIDLFIAVDITKRKEAEEALLESERCFRKVLEDLPNIGVQGYDRDGIVHYWNRANESIYGYSADEALGRNMLDLIIPPEMHTLFKEVIAFSSATGEVYPAGEHNLLHRDGSRVPVFSSHAVVRYQGREPEFFCLDVELKELKRVETELRNARDQLEIRVAERTAELEQTNYRLKKTIEGQNLLQNRLIRSERLAAIGQLAASVAHEINSPLQGIASILNSLRGDYGQDRRLMEKLGWVDDGYRKIRDTVKNLLDLNRPAKEIKAPVDVNAIIKSTVALVKTHLKKHKISLHTTLDSQSPHILASSQQLSQVFLNLINNAVDAMTGALVGAEPGREGFQGGAVTIATLLDNGNLIIKVSDSGPGIPEDDLERIFDPFYTRKKTMGMGVGLSICQSIVDEHHGSISVKNLTTRGAMFTISLPMQPGPVSQTSPTETM